MDSLPIASTAVRWLAGATIIFQLGLLAAVPIPSPVSFRRVWACYAGREPTPAEGALCDSFGAWLLPVVALSGLLAVVAAVIRPGGVTPLLLPVGIRFPAWLAPAGVLALLSGNGLIAAAVLALRRRTTFDATGQSRQLVTGGVFGFVQHPIVRGMGMIYLGFFLILPSPLVLAGLGCYAWHQKRRMAAEEVLLAKRFGARYYDYRRRTGRYRLRWPLAGRGSARHRRENGDVHTGGEPRFRSASLSRGR